MREERKRSPEWLADKPIVKRGPITFRDGVLINWGCTACQWRGRSTFEFFEALTDFSHHVRQGETDIRFQHRIYANKKFIITPSNKTKAEST